MGYYEGEQDPTFPWRTYINTGVTPATVKSNTGLTAVYVASQMRNAGRVSEQLQDMLGLSDNEIRACIDAVDSGLV